jgi:outer membrane biosynthesis protein TonB
VRTGIICSGILHIAAILIFIFGLPQLADHDQPEPDIIPVDIVNIADQTVNKKAPEEQKAEVQPEPQAAAAPETPTPPAPAADAVPVPDIKPDVEKKPEPKKEDKPNPLMPKASPLQKPTPPSRFDANRLALLIDKKLEKTSDNSKASDKPDKQNKPDSKPVERSSLDQARLSATLQAAIRAQVEPCWSVPAGAKEAADLKVHIRVYLLPDGNLARPPEIVDRLRMNMPGESFFRVAAESARRAVQKCAPLKLPAESYDIWKDTELTFDPREMLGG